MQRAKIVKAWKDDTIYGFLTLTHAERNTYKGTNAFFPPSIIQLTIGFAKKRRRDPHNYCGTVLKAVIDGLVLRRAWPDDTAEWIGHREPILVLADHTKVSIWPM